MQILTQLYPVTLNVNDLNTPIKRQRLSEWIKKQDLTIFCLEEIQFKYKDIYRLKVNEWRELHHVNTNQKNVGVAILFSDRTDFRTRKVIRDKESVT